jgi:hypothetical protein
MQKINATLYKTDGSKEPLVLSPKTRLKTLQKLVGGLIEVIHIVKLGTHPHSIGLEGNDLIINEEGNLLDLPINPWSQILGFNSIWEDERFRGDIILIDGRLP